jgi:2-phospho-L-lactate guanylyltransferase
VDSVSRVAEVVVPFAGAGGKTRLRTSSALRRELALAMLGDVLAAACAVADVIIVTSDASAARLAQEAGARVAHDPGGGLGPAVASALAPLGRARAVVVNADLPCARSEDVRALLAIGGDAVGLVEAVDGTTNALTLPAPAFAPFYGAGSAQRFCAHARRLGHEVVALDLPNLADDVDTLPDLARLASRLGPRTRAALDRAPLEVPA